MSRSYDKAIYSLEQLIKQQEKEKPTDGLYSRILREYQAYIFGFKKYKDINNFRAVMKEEGHTNKTALIDELIDKAIAQELKLDVEQEQSDYKTTTELSLVRLEEKEKQNQEERRQKKNTAVYVKRKETQE